MSDMLLILYNSRIAPLYGAHPLELLNLPQGYNFNFSKSLVSPEQRLVQMP